MFFGNLRGFLSEIEVADQLFHVVRQRRFQLAQGGGTHANQLAFVTALADHAGFFVAGNADARYAGGDDRRHQQTNAVAVGIGLEHRTDFRFVAEGVFQDLNIVFKRGFVDFNPGVAVLGVHLRDAIAHGQWWSGEGRGLQQCHAQRQGEQGASEREHASFHTLLLGKGFKTPAILGAGCWKVTPLAAYLSGCVVIPSVSP